MPLLLAAGAALLVPIAIVLAIVLGDGDDPAITAPDPGVTEVDPPPPCDDAPALPAASGDAVLADTEGRACTVELGWDADAQVLTVPRAGGDSIRYQLGEPGDVLLIGDWSCDGRQTPGLYRPTTGEVFTFDGFAGEGGELESRPAESTGTPDGDPVVTTDAEGCDRIEVRGDA